MSCHLAFFLGPRAKYIAFKMSFNKLWCAAKWSYRNALVAYARYEIFLTWIAVHTNSGFFHLLFFSLAYSKLFFTYNVDCGWLNLTVYFVYRWKMNSFVCFSFWIAFSKMLILFTAWCCLCYSKTVFLTCHGSMFMRSVCVDEGSKSSFESHSLTHFAVQLDTYLYRISSILCVCGKKRNQINKGYLLGMDGPSAFGNVLSRDHNS